MRIHDHESKNFENQGYIEAIIIAILIAFFIRTFIVQAFKIPSGSMKPTLQIGDHILVNKFIYGVNPLRTLDLIPVGEPHRGDIVVFIYPEDRSKDFVKRVIGTGGDTIQIMNKQIYLNGLPYKDTHGVYTTTSSFPAPSSHGTTWGPSPSPKGAIFVMGDNRDQSYDSRFWGFVDLKDVMGKAFIIYWSWDSDDNGVRWTRIGKLLN